MAILNQLLSFARCKLSLVDNFTRLRRVKLSRIAIVGAIVFLAKQFNYDGIRLITRQLDKQMHDRVLAWLEKEVPPHRVRHILGVETMAEELAEIYGVDRLKASQAGLMHDLAKYFKPQKLLKIAREAGLEIDEICQAHPHLIHADVSAIVARQEFGVEDPEILTAIANHTLGNPGMNPLSCILFVADTLEPNRGDTPELEQLRQISYQNLYQAVWLSCDYALKYLLDTRNLIHPRTIATRNWALRKS